MRNGKSVSKVALAFALTVALAIAISACGSSGDSSSGETSSGGSSNEEITLTVVPKLTSIEFYNEVRKGAECAAEKLGGVNIDWDGTTGFDINGEVNLLQNKITTGTDGIDYAASDTKALYPVTQQALNEGIPVVNFDSGTDPQPEEVPLYATDNVVNAQKVAELMAEGLPKGGEVALLRFDPGSETDQQRKQGFLEGLEKHPNLKLVAEQDGKAEAAEGLRVTEDILTAHPNIKAIFASDEQSTIGAANAIEQAGKVGEIQIYGWDASPEDIAKLKNGSVQALIAQNPFKMGVSSVNALASMVREGAEPKSEDTGAVVVTKEDLDSPEIQAVLKPTC